MVVRYVFDIGSGGTKSKAVMINITTQRVIQAIEKDSEPMGYQQCINNSGNSTLLSDICMRKGLISLFKIIEFYGLTNMSGLNCAGIATAWARNAQNSDDYIQRLHEYGFNIRVITQEEEGVIAYKAAQSYFKLHFDKDIPIKSLIWDIGGGSFQLCFKNQLTQKLLIYEGKYGASNFNHAVMNLFNETFFANTFLNKQQLQIAQRFADNTIAQPIKEFTNQNLDVIDLSNGVFGIGQMMNMGIKKLVKQDKINYFQVDKLIHIFAALPQNYVCNKYHDIQFEFLAEMQTNLLLVKSIMDGLNIEEVNFLDARSHDYVAFDPRYWDD